MLTLDGARARDVRIALGAVDATAIRATAAESLLDGAELTDEAIAEAAEAAASECDPASDATTTAAYRRALVARLVRDVLARVRSEAAGVSGTIGTSAPRARDLQLLTGRGRYVADLDLPGPGVGACRPQPGRARDAARRRAPRRRASTEACSPS